MRMRDGFIDNLNSFIYKGGEMIKKYYGFTKEDFRTACHNRIMHWHLDDFILNEEERELASEIDIDVHNLAMEHFKLDMVYPQAHLVDALVDDDKYYDYMIDLMPKDKVRSHLYE